MTAGSFSFSNIQKQVSRGVLFIYHLHGGVVHNHAVKCDVWVTGGDFSAALQKQTIAKLPVGAKRSPSMFPASRNSKLEKLTVLHNRHLRQSNSHDVGLVYSSDPLTTFFPGQSKGIVSDPEGIVPGDDLETFHNPGYTLKVDKEVNER